MSSLLGLETERLILRKVQESDADFLVQLMNDPAWLAYIGERNIKSREAALAHIHEVLFKIYEEKGFGMLLVEEKLTKEPMGLAGMIARKELQEPDIGYAFAPQGRSKGYAWEAASAVLNIAKEELSFDVFKALVHPDNSKSIRLLERLGFELMQPQPPFPDKHTLVYQISRV